MADKSGIISEVETAYRRYVEVFNSRDANEIARLYDRPHAQVIGEMGLSIVNDDADQQGWYEFVMAYLDNQGWERTEVDDMWVWPLSPTLAQLVAERHPVPQRWFRPKSRAGELHAASTRRHLEGDPHLPTAGGRLRRTRPGVTASVRTQLPISRGVLY